MAEKSGAGVAEAGPRKASGLRRAKGLGLDHGSPSTMPDLQDHDDALALFHFIDNSVNDRLLAEQQLTIRIVFRKCRATLGIALEASNSAG